ncbi:MAG TPA: hypothetical protein ENK50_08705, partial [Sedimenticola sp.]|nr:hypothetical protein [Sedimenticola sp.]
MSNETVEFGRNQLGGSGRPGRRCAGMVLLLWLLLSLAPAWSAENVLRDISFAALPGNRVQITIKAERPVSEPKT